MNWKLFLDDERYPAKDTLESNWRIARNVEDAMYYIKQYGMPELMSLDHDLGFMKLTGMDFVKRLVSYALDNNWRVLHNIVFDIHSMNNVGAENMRSYWKQATAWSSGQLDEILYRIQKGKSPK